MLAKIDIASAFMLIRAHPQLSRVMVTEFDGHHFGLEEDIMMFYGLLRFGWGSRYGHFCRFSDAIARLHQLFGPSQPLRNMPAAFRSKMYIDDGLFIELEIGDRKEQSTNTCEEIARGLFPPNAANEEKNAIEGKRIVGRIFLGLVIDAATLEIRSPEQKRTGDSVLFDGLFLSSGSQSVRIITLQRIRGNIEHLEPTNIIWEYFTRPADAHLGYGGEAGIWVNCGNRQLRKAFGGSMRAILLIRKNEERWSRLFCGSVERLLHPEPRFACQKYPERAIWGSVDAKLETVVGASWFGKEFFVLGAPPLIRVFKRNTQAEVIISECELLETLLISLLWGIRNGTPRSLTARRGNLNVFNRLQNWREKAAPHVVCFTPWRATLWKTKWVPYLFMYVADITSLVNICLELTKKERNFGLYATT